MDLYKILSFLDKGDLVNQLNLFNKIHPYINPTKKQAIIKKSLDNVIKNPKRSILVILGMGIFFYIMKVISGLVKK